MDSILETLEEIREFISGRKNETRGKSDDLPGDSSFSRSRLLTFENTVGLILDFNKESSAVLLERYFDAIGKECKAPTESAFSMRRCAVSQDFMEQLFDKTWQTYYHKNDVKTWKGFLVEAIDGSTVSLPDTDEIRGIYGVHKANGKSDLSIPMAVVVFGYDPLNDLFKHVAVGKSDSPELDGAFKIVEEGTDINLYLCDGYYPGFAFMYYIAVILHAHFLMKAYPSFSKSAQEFYESGKEDGIIEITASQKSVKRLKKMGIKVRRGEPLKVRALRVENPSGDYLLLTDLLDTEKYSPGELRDLYAKRWREEVSIGVAKNDEQLVSFSSSDVNKIKQDFWSTLINYNIESLIEKAPQIIQRIKDVKSNKYNYAVDKNIAFGIMKILLPKWISGDNPAEALDTMIQEISRHLRPIRPGRHSPRIFKNRKGKFRYYSNFRKAV